MNIFIVGSPWHLIVAIAISRSKDDDSRFLLERISDSSIASMINICDSVDLNYEIIGDIERVRFNRFKLQNALSFYRDLNNEFHSVTSKTIAISSNGNVGCVYYFNIFSPITRAQLRVYIDMGIKLVRVEDGICDYFDFPLIDYPYYQLVMKSIVSFFMGFGVFYSRNSDWISSNTIDYLVFFPEAISCWSGNLSPLLDYKKEILELFEKLTVNDCKSSCVDESVLLIGQTLYEDNFLSLDEEISIYARAASLGKDVIFKPHPRSSVQKINELKSLGLFNIVSSDRSVEELIYANKYSVVIGMWSNTIFYAPLIFGVGTKTMLNYIPDGVPSVDRVKNILKTKFADHLSFL